MHLPKKGTIIRRPIESITRQKPHDTLCFSSTLQVGGKPSRSKKQELNSKPASRRKLLTGVPPRK